MSNKLQGEAFSEIFYNSPVNMLIIDVDSPIYTILELNNAYLSATNTTREDLIGKPVFEVFPGNPTDSDSKNIERSIYSFEQALETRLPHVMSNYRYDIPIAGSTEFEERYWTTSNTPVLDKDGEVLYIIHSPINVTELNKLSEREKASIEAVRNQEEMLYNTFMHDRRQAKEEQSKLITLVDNSVDLMSILNLQGINTYINEAGKKMLGFESDEEVQSTHIAELHLPEDLEFVEKEVIPIVMKEGKWIGIINVRNKRTNEVFQVFNNCIRIDDPVSGEPIALGAVMRDLRPELASKQALADSEQLLRTITAASPTALWMSDDQGLCHYNNQTWLDWTGRTFDENLGLGWLDSVHPDDRAKVEDKFRSDQAARQLYEIEFRLSHADGNIHWCVANGQPQYGANGRFTGYVGACIDITDQKLLQQQKDDFIGIASHELKTPVTSIKAYTQVLEKMLQQKGETKEAEMISRMDGQINRLTSLIGDLLDVTKISSGKLQFNDRQFAFIPVVKELIEDLQRTVEKHTLVEEYQGNCIIFGDQERIGQVISNLVTNAVKYSSKADRIIIRTYVENDEVILSVTDFGIGIAKDKLNKVFEQFYRVSGDMQHTFPGLGLGLYISSEIIKREGGRIWVDSDEGKGSTFCFALPVVSMES